MMILLHEFHQIKKKKRGGRGEWEWGGDDNIGKYVLFFA